MTTDERLDRLTARHEALTQSVEMLLISSQESNRRMDTLSEQVNRRMDTLSEHVDSLVTSSDRLWKLYTLHERRLDDLEAH